MSHLTADAPAIALGTCVGLAAGLYADRALRQALSQDHQDGGEKATPKPITRWLLGLVSAVFGALVGARFGMHASLPAYLYLAAIAPPLSAVDAATRRLPDKILLPAYPASAALLGYAGWRGGDAGAVWRGLLAGALLYVVFLAIALATPPGSLGWADVKLSGLVGGFLGYLGWGTLVSGLTVAFVSAALYVVFRRMAGRGPHDQLLPLGPALLFGTLVAVIAS